MRKQMQIELKALQRRLGIAFLHVTHDQQEAFALSDWIIVMNHGVIEQQGDPETIYRRPANAYVADFIGGSNLIAGKAIDCAAGVATLETPFGQARAPCAPDVAAGQPASLCLRPEQLVIGAGDGFGGAVSLTVFQGADWLVEVAAGPARLHVRCPDEEPPAIGSKVSRRIRSDQGLDRGRHACAGRSLSHGGPQPGRSLVLVGPVPPSLWPSCAWRRSAVLFVYSFFHVDFVTIVPIVSLHNYAQVLASGPYRSLILKALESGAVHRRDHRSHRLSGGLLHRQTGPRREGGVADRVAHSALHRRSRAHLRLAPDPRDAKASSTAS